MLENFPNLIVSADYVLLSFRLNDAKSIVVSCMEKSPGQKGLTQEIHSALGGSDDRLSIQLKFWLLSNLNFEILRSN